VASFRPSLLMPLIIPGIMWVISIIIIILLIIISGFAPRAVLLALSVDKAAIAHNKPHATKWDRGEDTRLHPQAHTFHKTRIKSLRFCFFWECLNFFEVLWGLLKHEQ
jgi:hypothetical protein